MAESDSWRNVGKRIRLMRKDNGLTLKQLADGCDLSPNAISLVERGEVAPTVMTLCKIAHALGVSASSLFLDICSTDVILTRAMEGPEQTQQEIAVNILTKKGIQMPMYLGKSNSCSFAGSKTQMVLCVSGTIEYLVDEHCYLLNPGDSLTFNGGAFHRWRNSGLETGVAVMVLTPQTIPTNSGD